MIVASVVVAHREMMVAEGISAALARFPGMGRLVATTAAADAERLGAYAQAVALDPRLPGALLAAGRLRRRGVRVVFLGNARGEEGVRVTTGAPVSALAAALLPPTAAAQAGPGDLTARQREILRLIGRGLTGKEIGKTLGISPKTVERHKSRIFARLGVPNQAAAVFAYREWIEGDRVWNGSTT